MVLRTAVMAMVIVVAGCTGDRDGHGSGAGAPQGSVGQLLTDTTAPPVRARSALTFANLPDRGKLLVYPDTHSARRDGAYTWHGAELSEAHALRAISEGKLRITTPSGETLSFDYERHVEHPSGDWTWIGHLEGGAPSDEAIITFGERAVFGSIAEPGREPLRLTTRGGRSWLVETDRAMLAAVGRMGIRRGGPDFLVPPKLAATLSASNAPPLAGAAGSGTAAASTSSTTTVDVALGYTPGFAAANNGAPTTRLNFLVEVANQAYINSQVNSRIRLVSTTLVDYPDATDNGDVLEKLTGYRSKVGPITPDPAFDALRAARDQYGADLVSLVRQFQTPQNDGCGIAWLIGGGQSGIDSGDAPFGYSVVSDGTDVDEGNNKTYFCRDETLAHEFGHNSGSQHDRATATVDGVLKYGVFPYSFGYKTAAGAGNFYTVMAYGESGQTRFRVFSNPGITYCGGFACGIENDSDNARSLNQTTPTVATFRATIVALPDPVTRPRPRNDVDADGKSDLLWYHPAMQRIAYWVMNGNVVSRHGGQVSGGDYRVVAKGDYNGDGRVDLIWNGPQGDMQMWEGDGTGFIWRPFYAYPSGWELIGSEDVDADGKSDLLWYHPAMQRIAYWVMNGNVVSRHGGQVSGGDYRVVAKGDYNGDGRVDLIWNGPQGDMQMWEGNGTGFIARPFYTYPSGWELIGSEDVDADGKSDLLWYHPAMQRIAYWVMNGNVVSRHGGQVSGGDYRVVAKGDYNGDGRVDLIWNGPQGDMQMWEGDGTGFIGRPFYAYPSGWELISR